MASIQIQISEHLLKQLEEDGLLTDSVFFANALAHELERRHQQKVYTQEEMMAALEELDGLFADEEWTMEDMYELKRQEKELEERKLNRL